MLSWGLWQVAHVNLCGVDVLSMGCADRQTVKMRAQSWAKPGILVDARLLPLVPDRTGAHGANLLDRSLGGTALAYRVTR